MKPPRWLEQPRWLVLLALAFALAPVWLAWVTYREARSKDERLFETSAQMLADQLRRELGNNLYLLSTMRGQALPLNRAALLNGKFIPKLDWQKRLPHLLAFGYADLTNSQVLLGWKSEERTRLPAVGENLAADRRVAAVLKFVRPSDGAADSDCVLDQHRLLILFGFDGSVAAKVPRGYIAGWIDLESLCHDQTLPLLQDQVLAATPLAENESTPGGAKRISIIEGGSQWGVGIARGANFNQRYGPPPRWLAFTAVALSAVPLLLILVLAGRAAKLGATLATEREIARQQNFFTQSVSHEFRTPLGIILSGADLLDNYLEQLSPERRREVLAEIKANTRLMNEMLERVLLLGRIEASKLSCSPKPVALAAFCDDAARKVTTATNARCPVAVTADGRAVMLDAAIVGSILDNLLANAVKYSAPGKTVALLAVVEKNSLVFTVRDEGIGIPAEDLPRVCDPFHRCANVGEVPGTGLGLAIARRSAVLHGGALNIESVEGRGTTATLTLPLEIST